MSSKLFVFNRDLPSPFDTLKSKTVNVSSTYGDGTNAKLTSTVSKAVLAFCQLKDGKGQGALGTQDTKTVSEYKSSEADKYHISVYDSVSGSIQSCVYDVNTESIEQYIVGNKARDGAGLLLALLPTLMSDQEFQDHLESFYNHYLAGFTDMKAASADLAMLCDNAYRRISDDICPAHVKVNIENSGNITRISQMHLDSGVFEPKQVICGEFTIFAHSAAAPVFAPMETVDHNDFVGNYPLNPGRTLNPKEQKLVPVLEPWYILPQEVVSVCRHAQTTTGKSAPMRNFLLRGPAGTGKTAGAKAIAAGLGLPYVLYTCSANTEVYDFIGMMFPDTDSATTGDAELDAQRKELQSMGGVTYENVFKLMGLPELDDMDYDPEGVYAKLTGISKANASSQDCMAAVMSMVTEKVQQLCAVKTENKTAGQTYSYVETDFIRALKYGWVIEVQEPATIIQPGVLVGLNSLLEQSGNITLPTGEIIRRHPDAVVVVTTNVDYEGCRGINQSVVDRMSLVLDIDLPSPEVMTQRAMSVTGCEDDYMVSQMVQVVNDMADYCHKNGITDGSVGMRGLIDWIISTEITGDAYQSALVTVISKATADSESRESLIAAALEPIFAPTRKKAGA
ncbi:MAG: ATP-binding protein [Firmicutes bacterium]|nr:ATP-binding protein [Bacillota bacterium]